MKTAFALIAAILTVSLPTLAAASAHSIVTAAEYTEPTTRYNHGILGDNIEWGALKLTVEDCSGCDTPTRRAVTIRLPLSRVFEDTEPRLVDINADGAPEAMVVETDIQNGARLAIYDQTGLVTSTPFIGTTNRWLAPLGVADLDGDGTIEVAYVDRPHLARLIKVWRVQGDLSLKLVAELKGFTNHAIGETDIAGGIRNCGNGPEMIVADSRWRDIYAVTFANDTLSARKLGPHKGRVSFRRAMNCNM